MKLLRRLSITVLCLMFAIALAADLASGASYSHQYREFTNAPPSARFPLGTDDLGRDRLMRLLHATGISMLLAPSAALAATVLAALAGGFAGYFGGWYDRLLVRIIDLMLSLPWLFLLLAARALLPLNAAPLTSLIVTYGLLAALGWASPARVVRAGARQLRESEFVFQARACGSGGLRLLLRQIVPNLRPVLLAQFLTAIPVFILAEANLGMLGLSAGEPYPTWGNLLQELQSPSALRPEVFAPLSVVALSVCCFKLIFPMEASRL